MPFTVAHVEHGDARFTAEQTANAGFCRHISQVINVRCGRTVIRDGTFHANHTIDNRHVFFHGTRNGAGRDMISAGQHPGADAFFIERTGLGEQGFRVARDRVGAQQTNH